MRPAALTRATRLDNRDWCDGSDGARDTTRTEDDDSNFEAYWWFTSPAPPARQRVTYMYVCMDRKCVSAAVTTVGTPTETSAKYHAIDNIITTPNHSTLLQ